jgi:ketosteroid isomerase-like protein
MILNHRSIGPEEMMKRKPAASILAALALAVAASACGTPKTEDFTTQDAGAIRQKSEGFVAAFNGKQIPQIMDMYAENATFMPPNRPVLRGRDAIRNFYDELVNQMGATNLRLDVSEVVGHGPIAYQAGSYEIEYKPATATASPRDRDRGKYLFVLRNLGTTWRYEYTVWNSDLLPAGH